MILDVCCGPKHFWFDRDNPNVIFGDKRKEEFVLKYASGSKDIDVSPMLLHDFTALPFGNNQFEMVVFDPPHLIKAGENSYMRRKYGILDADWKGELTLGFSECLRVLEPGGTLIFKWNEVQATVAEVMECCSIQPLFGHKSGKASKTHWLCYKKEKQND